MLDLPGAFTDMPDYPNLYMEGKNIKTMSGCQLGSRGKQVKSELCASSSKSVTVITLTEKCSFWKQHLNPVLRSVCVK